MNWRVNLWLRWGHSEISIYLFLSHSEVDLLLSLEALSYHMTQVCLRWRSLTERWIFSFQTFLCRAEFMVLKKLKEQPCGYHSTQHLILGLIVLNIFVSHLFSDIFRLRFGVIFFTSLSPLRVDRQGLVNYIINSKYVSEIRTVDQKSSSSTWKMWLITVNSCFNKRNN